MTKLAKHWPYGHWETVVMVAFCSVTMFLLSLFVLLTSVWSVGKIWFQDNNKRYFLHKTVMRTLCFLLSLVIDMRVCQSLVCAFKNYTKLMVTISYQNCTNLSYKFMFPSMLAVDWLRMWHFRRELEIGGSSWRI